MNSPKAQVMRTQKAAAANKRTKRAAPTAKVIPLPKPVSSDPVIDLINTWVPGGDGQLSQIWPEIAADVRLHLLATKIGSPEVAKRYIRAVARHAASRHLGGHAIGEVEELFSDTSLASTFAPHSSSTVTFPIRPTDLAFLRRIRANLLPALYAKPAPIFPTCAPIASPYSEKELTELLTFARQRSTELSIYLHGALLLSLAAGLTGSELMCARGSDLIRTPWGLFISTQGLISGGNRAARQVPILAHYEVELSSLARTIGDGLFLGAPLSDGAREPGTLQPRASSVVHFRAISARSNWIQSAIAGGASFLALRQAGVSVSRDSYLFILSAQMKIAFPAYIKQMRGSETAFNPSNHQHLLEYQEGK
jgi:hypothetical protein